ncbi:hypothetical protein AB0J80_06130 [Actinoplanes sp. NPDC049548]|uniref:hypothetical protein n=1 Tax=Actinoplanes sp. NPDC049548 TaxID=3155152 RepID=UPI00341F068C
MLPAVLALTGLAVMATAIVETVIYGIGSFGRSPQEMVDEWGMNARIQWSCLPVLAAVVWTLLIRRPWWIPVTLGAPVILVALPTLAQEVPRNGVPVFGFLPAALLVIAGVVGNAMGLRSPR